MHREDEEMFSTKNKLMKEKKKGEKVTYYGIRKLSVGVASVAIASGLLFASEASLVHAEGVDRSVSEGGASSEILPLEEKRALKKSFLFQRKSLPKNKRLHLNHS